MGPLVVAAATSGADFLSFFANPVIRDLSAVAVLTGVVVMILMGRLIPISTHKREIEAANQRTRDAVLRGDEWKQAAEDTAAVNKIIRQQVSDMTQSNQVLEQFLRAAGPSFGDTRPAGGA